LPVRATEAYPELFRFLGGHLHQDWPEDAASADEAVEQAIAGAPRERLATVADEIDALLRTCRAEQALQDAVVQLCEYHPPGDGLTYREWLRDVRMRLRQGDGA
jgi:hypothetical protein